MARPRAVGCVLALAWLALLACITLVIFNP
jgi:hypothetical protein